MKKDFRLRYAGWQMLFIVFIMILAVILDSANIVIEEQGFFIEFNGFALVGFVIAVVLAYIILFSQLAKHNKNYPEKKISLFSKNPPEYMEDDEFFKSATGNATKKVYTYFTWALPFVVVFFIVVPLDRLWIIETICLLGLMQYFIYYREMRKLMTIEED